MLEQVAGTRDQIHLLVTGSLDDPLKGVPQILTASSSPRAEQALAGERPVQMYIGEMEQAKGHKSPVTTRILPGAMA
jgi:hypothetical protein